MISETIARERDKTIQFGNKNISYEILLLPGGQYNYFRWNSAFFRTKEYNYLICDFIQKS